MVRIDYTVHMTTEEIIRQAVIQAFDEGMTDGDFAKLARRIAVEETERRREETARALYGKDSA